MAQPAFKLVVNQSFADNPSPVVETVALALSIRAIGREAWNACYPDELEDYDYLLAIEEAGIKGFMWRYAVIREGEEVIACMPAFLTDYNLATTLDAGWLKNLIQHIQSRFPRFLTMKLACLGSPMTECGTIGFHPGVREERKAELLRRLLRYFAQETHALDFRLTGVKDMPKRQKALWDDAALPMGFRLVPGMATAHLDIDFSSIEGYLARLGSATRKDMRRKLKMLPELRIERRDRLDDVLPQVHALYLDTKNRSDFAFEELTETYFSGVLRRMGGRAHCTLYYAEDKLLAANLMLADGRALLDKFFCMDSVHGRAYNLYFVSWFTNLCYCLNHGIPHYQSGQAGYGSKLRLGSRLSPNWLLFRHANPLLNGLLRLASPLLASGGESAL